jgi:molybdenum cofactor sulfurtransferase
MLQAHSTWCVTAAAAAAAAAAGCFCNPGACCSYLQLSSTDLLSNHAAGHICWDDNDIVNGRPTGAVRVSFGYMSSYDDLAALLDFLHEFFVDSRTTPPGQLAAAGAAAAVQDAAEAAAASVAQEQKVSANSSLNSNINGDSSSSSAGAAMLLLPLYTLQ